MSNARKLADLLDSAGDVKSAHLDNVPASDNASALSSGTLPNARLPSNISDAGTEGTKVAAGTTAQRGSTTGQWRFNSTTGFFEGYDGTQFSTLAPTPTVTSVDDTEVDSAGGGNQTIVVTGTNFSAGGVIAFVGSSAEFNAATTTYNSATQVTAVAPKSSFLNAQEPYKVRFTSSVGNIGTSASGLINVDNAPTWTTAAGNIATISDRATGTHVTVAAADAEGDTIAYSVVSGSIPPGTSLNSSTGVISGDPTNVGSATTSSFDLRATANSKTTDRSFNIIVNPTPSEIEWLVIAGGGAGGGNYYAGAGGAGGYQTNFGGTKLTLTIGNQYTATVGAGGSTNASASGGAGANSSLAGTGITTITSIGGGYGRTGGADGGAGGSGGGAGKGDGSHSGGSATSGQGYAGGGDGNGSGGGGGGGGAAAVGGEAGGSGAGAAGFGGAGGAGVNNSITGSSVGYAGGGGGGGWGGDRGIATHGGGNGGQDTGSGGCYAAVAGTDGTGGGGGGSSGYSHCSGFTIAGAGGKGVVIIRVPTVIYSGTTTGSPTITTDGTDTIIKFLSTGTYTA